MGITQICLDRATVADIRDCATIIYAHNATNSLFSVHSPCIGDILYIFVGITHNATNFGISLNRAAIDNGGGSAVQSTIAIIANNAAHMAAAGGRNIPRIGNIGKACPIIDTHNPTDIRTGSDGKSSIVGNILQFTSGSIIPHDCANM